MITNGGLRSASLLAVLRRISSSAQLPGAAAICLVITLAALGVGPVAFARDMARPSARRAIAERMQAIVAGIRALMAEETIHNIAFRRGELRAAGRYGAARDEEEQNLRRLSALAVATDPHLAMEVDSFRVVAARWHRRPDARVAGRLGESEFEAALPALRTLHDTLSTSMQRVKASLARRRSEDESDAARVISSGRRAVAVAWLCALLATAVVLWYARCDRVLSRKLRVALEAEATARAESEERRAHLERLTEHTERLVRGFSHDVKNSMGSANGFMQLLQDGVLGPLTARQAGGVERALHGLQNALGLLDDLTGLAQAKNRQIGVESEAVDLGALVREVADEFRPQAEHKSLTLLCESDADDYFAWSDPARLRQVICNLVSNAVKYTASGTVRLRVWVDGDRTAIEVADTGSGIPPEQQRRVFDEFVRLDPDAAPGAGIGLAFSQRIAHLLDGEITLTSEIGKGSRFTLWVPTGEVPARTRAGALVESVA